MAFSNKIRRARELAGLTQIQLAEKVGFEQSQISYHERLKSSEDLTLKTLRPYAEFFGLAIEDLVPKPKASAR